MGVSLTTSHGIFALYYFAMFAKLYTFFKPKTWRGD